MVTPRQSSRVVVTIVAVADGLNFHKTLPVPNSQTLGWAVNASGLYGQAPHLRGAKLGVWGKALPPETLVAENDRIEVYTPASPEALKAHRTNLQKTKTTAKVTVHA